MEVEGPRPRHPAGRAAEFLEKARSSWAPATSWASQTTGPSPASGILFILWKPISRALCVHPQPSVFLLRVAQAEVGGSLGLSGLWAQVLASPPSLSSRLGLGLGPRFFICFSRALDLNCGAAFPLGRCSGKMGLEPKEYGWAIKYHLHLTV